MNEKLTFGGVSSDTYKVYISGESVYNAPARDVNMVTVPGRNGTISIDNGRFENIEVTYPAFCWGSDQAAFADRVSDFRNALMALRGYQRLTDDFHPGEYRMGIFREAFEVTPTIYNTAGEFEVVFDCKPQRWLTSGETAVAVSSGSTITNPTSFASEPLIKITGDGTLYVGEYSLVIDAGASNPVYIDCELMEAYEIDSQNYVVNRNSLVTYQAGTFPRIVPGANLVTYSGNITAVEITPRWWRI